MTSSGITAREPQQNPVLVFSITLTQKRVRPPVWIILVLQAELASVRSLLLSRFESGWEVGVIALTFVKKGPDAGKFSAKYKDDPNWWTHSLLREGYEKTSTGFC